MSIADIEKQGRIGSMGASSRDIDALIATLDSADGLARQTARERLQDIGQPAVRLLIKAMDDPNEDVRWEAAKALGEIGDPAAAPALVNALEDRNSGVRWLGACGLISLKQEALTPLLHALCEPPTSAWLRMGAHHVIHDLSEKWGMRHQLAPVLAALESVASSVEISPVAQAVLKQLSMESQT